MKRDLDLIRAILLAIQNHPHEHMDDGELRKGIFGEGPEPPLWSSEQIVAHVRLLTEAGLVTAHIENFIGGDSAIFQLRLTSDGQDFIADAKHDQVWQEVKAKGGDFSFAVLKGMLVEAVKKLME